MLVAKIQKLMACVTRKKANFQANNLPTFRQSNLEKEHDVIVLKYTAFCESRNVKKAQQLLGLCLQNLHLRSRILILVKAQRVGAKTFTSRAPIWASLSMHFSICLTSRCDRKHSFNQRCRYTSVWMSGCTVQN